jgi:hypothetical protein
VIAAESSLSGGVLASVDANRLSFSARPLEFGSFFRVVGRGELVDFFFA